MPVTLLRPNREPEESALDKLVKGFQLAQGVLGTVEGVQNIADRPERNRLAREKAEREAEAFQTAQKQAQADLEMTQKETSLLGQEKPMSAMERRLKQAELDLKMAQADAARNKPAPLSESQKVFERERAKGLSQYAEARDALLSDVESLKEARKMLAESENGFGMTTGPIVGPANMINPFAQDYAQIKNTIDRVTQKNLKKILGGQFAQKEGEQVLKRGFNPMLSEKANLETLDSLISMLESGISNREAELANLEKSGRVLGTKYADPGRQMSAEDKEALQWANANPNDPRSKEIKLKLGISTDNQMLAR